MRFLVGSVRAHRLDQVWPEPVELFEHDLKTCFRNGLKQRRSCQPE